MLGEEEGLRLQSKDSEDLSSSDHQWKFIAPLRKVDVCLGPVRGGGLGQVAFDAARE